MQVPCEFSSTAELVLGQNNVPFWTRTVDSLAVAVTEEAPFTVEIVEPKVPIVRGGSMDLKVVARRKPGFTAPIAIALPWNPPGIASKNESVIAENQNEATIPINASGGAELKTWRIVVNGTYTEPPPAPPAGATQGAAAAKSRRPTRGIVRIRQADGCTAVLDPEARGSQRRAGERSRREREGEQGGRLRRRAKMTLIGLPNKVTTSPVTITKDTTEAVFHLKTDAKTPPGETKSLFCQVLVVQNGEPILHNLGSGRLRVDAPLARKKPPASGPAIANRSSRAIPIAIKNRPRQATQPPGETPA